MPANPDVQSHQMMLATAISMNASEILDLVAEVASLDDDVHVKLIAIKSHWQRMGKMINQLEVEL